MIQSGAFRARLAADDVDVVAAQRLRYRAFGLGEAQNGRDRDAFDDRFSHLLIETDAGALVATLRFQLMSTPADISQGYSAQFYDLSPISDLVPAVEVGRFCMDPDAGEAGALRFAMAVMTHVVLAADAVVMFGCSSFAGLDPRAHAGAFATLSAHHLGPAARQARPTTSNDFALAEVGADTDQGDVSPLLRGYLAMGGWVSGRGVIDPDMGTHHVLTVVEVADVPPARRRVLHALAEDLSGTL